MAKNEVTITTEEYRELISKGVPNENDKYFKAKLEEFLEEEMKIEGSKLDAKNDWNFSENFEKWLKIIDKPMYKRIYNKLYDEKMKKETDKMKMKKARANKNIDNDEE